VRLIRVWRLIDSGLVDGPTSQAIDEAIREARLGEVAPNTLHLYRRKSPTVSIGRYQKIGDVVDLEFCRERGIDIVRRTSGGGTIYTDSNCLEYAVVVDQGYPEIPMDLEGSFKVICSGVITALKKLGIDAAYKPVNDVQVRGRKISGSAQRRRRILLQHGTLLVDADFESMSKALRGGDEGGIKLMERLTTVRREAGRVITVEEVSEALKMGFEESLSMKLVKGKLTPWEEGRVKELTEKYRSISWIRKVLKNVPS
jgi:lipoate-protein ligase A